MPISPEKPKCRTTTGDEEMTRCVEFYTRWKKDPNWCHKCGDAVRQIESYIDLVDGLEKRGIPQETTIVGLPEGVARPLIAIQDEEIKEKAIIKCMERLNGEIGAGRGDQRKCNSARRESPKTRNTHRRGI